MTRKQAEKVVDEIVRLARVAGRDTPEWTQVALTISTGLAEKIDSAPQMINGCMPMGWHVSGATGTTVITVHRRNQR